MQRHNKTLDMVRESLLDLDAIVARHREDFTGDFFQHLHLLTEACQDDFDRREGTSSDDHAIELPYPLLSLLSLDGGSCVLIPLCFMSSSLVRLILVPGLDMLDFSDRMF